MTWTPEWMMQLQPASWNGVTFAVNENQFTFGRRVAIHEYPYRDHPWIEDLGRDLQRVEFRGFLVGDDVYDQRDQMVQACDQSGVGELVHPSLGSQKAYLITSTFGEDKQRGRVVEVDLQFIIADDLQQKMYPLSIDDTQVSTENFADDLGGAASSDFFGQVGQGILQGAAILNTATSYAQTVLAPLQDAARIVNCVNGMGVLCDTNHSYGRYISGNVSSVSSALGSVNRGLSMIGRTTAGVNALIFDTVNLRAGVSVAATNMTNFARAL